MTNFNASGRAAVPAIERFLERFYFRLVFRDSRKSALAGSAFGFSHSTSRLGALGSSRGVSVAFGVVVAWIRAAMSAVESVDSFALVFRRTLFESSARDLQLRNGPSSQQESRRRIRGGRRMHQESSVCS